MKFNKLYLVWAIFLISGCTALTSMSLDRKFGRATPRDTMVESLTPHSIDYWSEVKPIIESRCIACHGCYDAPCQLKMTSIEGILRGANEREVYHSTRVSEAAPSRLFTDAHSVDQWRSNGFHPVLNERSSTAQANLEGSVMRRLLDLKQSNPLPEDPQLSEDDFTLSIGRKQECPAADEMGKFARKHPLWGMPYALPALNNDEHHILSQWIEQGATYTPRTALPKGYVDSVAKWEAWLNSDSLKHRLASRYIYEHLSYAHFYFSEFDEPRFFSLVRSATPPGEAISVIASRRPYDNPQVPRVYYRLQEVVSSIVDKSHLPYALHADRLNEWQALFVDADYEVTALPGYNTDGSNNPFVTFASLPVTSRYKFMLHEAQFTIMAFIKGPVCRGDVAVGVIDDHFWVFFTDPDLPEVKQLNEFLAAEEKDLHLPADYGSIYRAAHRWHQFENQQKGFLQRKTEFLSASERPAELDLIWDGDGFNDNAGLTVFRHSNSASVDKGLLGRPPKTSWLIDYSLLERIHYLLVAGYDVYGNLGHQLDTRLYMDLLRMEGESNFLMLLPQKARTTERDFWYRDASETVKSYVLSPAFATGVESGIAYQTNQPKLELYSLLELRLQAVLPQNKRLESITNHSTRTQLQQLETLTGEALQLLPNVAIVKIADSEQNQWVSLVYNVAYSSVNTMFGDVKKRIPEEDTLSVVPGFVGSYPNAFYVVKKTELTNFIAQLSAMESEDDYRTLLDNYGVRRTNQKFWAHSDLIHEYYQTTNPIEFGRLDYGRLENR